MSTTADIVKEDTATAPAEDGSDVRGCELNVETVTEAVEALLTHLKSSLSHNAAEGSGESGDAESEETQVISLVCVYKCPPKRSSLRPRSIPLAHSLHNPEEDDVCLFVKDPQYLVKDHLGQEKLETVPKVIGVSKLEKKYGTHEGRRELCQLFDVFLVDDRVAPMMPRLLGNAFVQTKKLPLVVRMDGDVAKNIERALRSTSFTPNSGTVCPLRVAKTCFSAQQIVENIMMAAGKLASLFPNGLRTFQTLYIKSESSPSLPIFFSAPDAVDYLPTQEERASMAASVRRKKSLLAKRSKSIAKALRSRKR